MRRLQIDCLIDPDNETTRVYRMGSWPRWSADPNTNAAYERLIGEVPNVQRVLFSEGFAFVTVNYGEAWGSGADFLILERLAGCMGASMAQVRVERYAWTASSQILLNPGALPQAA